MFKPSPILSGDIDVKSNHWKALSPQAHLNGALGEKKIVSFKLFFHKSAIDIKSFPFAPYPWRKIIAFLGWAFGLIDN